MKQPSKGIFNLNFIIGLLIILGSGFALRDNLPIYAWLILAIILAVYLWNQLGIIRNFGDLLMEKAALIQAKNGSSLSGETEVAKRQIFVDHLSAQGRSVPSNAFREILSARLASKQVNNGAYAVVLLGLLGTFIGLAEVISNAGGMTGDIHQGIDEMIPIIFGNMQGIFGTTLCGLAASFLLRRNEEMLESANLDFYADLEEYTQFELLPQLEQGGENPISEGLLKLSRSFTDFQDNISQSLIQPLRAIIEDSQSSVRGLIQESQQSFIQLLSDSKVSMMSSLDQELRNSQLTIQEQTSQMMSESRAQLKQEVESLSDSRNSAYETIQSSLVELTHSIQVGASKNSELLIQQSQNQSEVFKKMGENIEARLEQAESMEDSHRSVLLSQLNAIDERHQEFLNHFKHRGEDWINSLQDFSSELSEGMTKLNERGIENLSENFTRLSESAQLGLESTTQLSSEVQVRLEEMMSGLSGITDSVSEASETMKVNQVEMQSTIEMFNHGVEMILETLAARGEDSGEEQNFYQKLETSLELFHEKASESLIENSVRTQEILLQILQESTTHNHKSESGV
jgi:hypothetical protein